MSAYRSWFSYFIIQCRDIVCIIPISFILIIQSFENILLVSSYNFYILTISRVLLMGLICPTKVLPVHMYNNKQYIDTIKAHRMRGSVYHTKKIISQPR